MTGGISMLALTPAILAGLLLASGFTGRIDGVIRIATLLTLIGTAVAYRQHRRRPDQDPFVVIARWSNWGLVVGIAIQVVAVVA